MKTPRQELLSSVPDGVLVADSVTDISAASAGTVAVTGSHGAAASGRFAVSIGVSAAVFNDAGGGFESAGLRALCELEAACVPAAVVAHTSARIGDGRDTFESGIVSARNDAAKALGVGVGMSCASAATLLTRSTATGTKTAGAKFHDSRFSIGDHLVATLDSASQIEPSLLNHVVVTGSHGGLVGNSPTRALKHPVRFAAFNDAGVGKENAGISRLSPLDDQGISAVAVSSSSAEIGSGLSTLEQGIVSSVNEFARAEGAVPGMALIDLIEALSAAPNA